jgi:hypothetical protein
MAQASKNLTAGSSYDGVWIGDCPEAERLKRFNCLKDQFREIGQRAENGLAGEWRILSEDYINARVSLVVYLHLAHSGNDRSDSALRHGNEIVHKSIAMLVFDIETPKAGKIDGWNEKFVLVDIVKLADLPELKLSSRVRLYFIKDEGGKIGIPIPDRPKTGKGLHVAPSLGHWKAQPIRFGIGELYDDMVECGSQVVNGIANDGRYLRWIRGRRIDLERICSGIPVFVGADYGKVVCVENGHDCTHEFAEMAFCPRDLQSCSQELLTRDHGERLRKGTRCHEGANGRTIAPAAQAARRDENRQESQEVG